MGCRIHVRGDGAERGIPHVVEQVVVHDVAGTDDPDAALVEAALGKLLHEIAALAAGHEHEHGVGFGILHALQERREIGIHQGHLDLLDDFTAGRR